MLQTVLVLGKHFLSLSSSSPCCLPGLPGCTAVEVGAQRHTEPWAPCGFAVPVLLPTTSQPTDLAAGVFTTMEKVCLLLFPWKLQKEFQFTQNPCQ